MESIPSNNGIFMQSSNLDSSFMLRTLQSLLDIEPSSNITSFYNDKIYRGFRVYFEEPTSTAILERKYILVSDKYIRLYPLTTFLTVHDIFMAENDSSQNILRDEIEKNFGNVLSLCPAPENPSSILNRNWRVEIAVPETRDLSVFEKNGYPEMCITLPNKTVPFKITFWCRTCKKDGHVQQDCLKRLQSSKSDVLQKKKNSAAETCHKDNIEMMPRSAHMPSPESNSSGNSTTRSKINIFEPIESFARKIGKEEIMKAGVFSAENAYVNKEFGKPNNNSLTSQVSDTPNSTKKSRVKNETGDKTQNNECEKNTANTITIKKEPIFEGMQDEDTCPFPLDRASSFNLDDDDVQIVKTVENKSSSNEIKSLNSKKILDVTITGGTKLKDVHDNSSNPPSWRIENSNRTPSVTSFSFSNVPGPSVSSGITSSLSQRLQYCFKRAYDDYPVLDEQQLDAFLTHVKKKSNPIRVAGNYTQNPQGLKNQLKQILHYYYNTPQTGTKEDIQFVKWLNGLVERFEGTPCRKRKRPSKSDE